MNSWYLKLMAAGILVFAAVFSYGKFGPGIPITSVVTQKQELFSVTGEGKVTVVPDTAIVSLGITLNKPTVKAAQNGVNAVISEITKSLKALGIDAKDIKTSNYSIYPQYDYQTTGGNRISGYQVSANLTVKVREFDKVNQVVDEATAKGANNVGGIQLTVDETKQKELLQQARELAVKDAKSKAESLASAAGMTLGKIVNIQEDYGNFPRPIMNYGAGMLAADSVAKTNIEPGSTDVTTSVTLFYETR